jgi:hypothetical protein
LQKYLNFLSQIARKSWNLGSNIYAVLCKFGSLTRAIENIKLFWDYIALLDSQGTLDIKHMSAFATPKNLGFLCPIENAKTEDTVQL